MKFHHIGFAVRGIDDCISSFVGEFRPLSGKVYDGGQLATLLLANWNGITVELIEGAVSDGALHETEELGVYHTCFEVESVISSIANLMNKGYYQVSAIKPAPLFDNRDVVFMMDKFGNVIELLECVKKEEVKL